MNGADLWNRRLLCTLCDGFLSGLAVQDRDVRARLQLVLPVDHDLLVGLEAGIDECLAFARRAGYREIVLWTNDILAAARRIYQRAGFELVDSEPHHSFGHDLVGQNWRLSLD